jgi:ABC-type polysaccharide/polyol phosphate export permease
VFRWAVLGRGAIDWSIQIPSLAVLVVVLVAGILYFRRVETSFADSI